MLPIKFRFIWKSGNRGEDFQKSTNQKQELPVAAMLVNGLRRNEQQLQRTRHRCFLLSFSSFDQAVSEEKIFLNRPIRNKNCLWWPVNGSELNEQSLQRTFHRCFLPYFDSFGQGVTEEKIFRNQPIRNKNCLWWPFFITDRDEMSNLYRGPTINASYQVSVHLVKRLQRRRFFRN